jgi:hypothetical protein
VYSLFCDLSPEITTEMHLKIFIPQIFLEDLLCIRPVL